MELSVDPLTNTAILPPPATAPCSPPPPTSQAVLVPCAGCKILRRRCSEKCIFAPYFPPTEPHKFAIAHRVFGAANVVKLLREIPESWRADAVNSMVYEANARLRDPVYGSAGTISHLQDQVTKLQAQLAVVQAEIVNAQSQNSNLFSELCMGDHHSTQAQQDEEQGLATIFPYHHHQQLMSEQQAEDTDLDLLDENFLNSEWRDHFKTFD